MMEYAQPLELTLHSLLVKELSSRLPQTLSVPYYDFATGVMATQSIELKAMVNIYRHPSGYEADYPFVVIQVEREDLPTNTQNAQDEKPQGTIQVWDLDFDSQLLNDRIKAYAKIVTNIINENSGTIRKYLKLGYIKVTDQVLLPSRQRVEDEAIIRGIICPIEAKGIEEY